MNSEECGKGESHTDYFMPFSGLIIYCCNVPIVPGCMVITSTVELWIDLVRRLSILLVVSWTGKR